MNSALSSRVLAHRGHWKSEFGFKELGKNSVEAIHRAVELGFGIETDIRDYMGEVVISHDPADETSLEFEKLLSIEIRGLVALNVKSDGSANKIESMFNSSKPNFEYFFFDMSYPEGRKYESKRLPIANRKSEYERLPEVLSRDIWVDCFDSDWYTKNTDWFTNLDANNIVLVSPELHNRSHKESWKWITTQMTEHQNLFICTDMPLEFLNFWEKQI